MVAAFVAFLDEAPLNPVKEELAQRPGASGKGFFQWFGETVQSISQTYVLGGGWPTLLPDPASASRTTITAPITTRTTTRTITRTTTTARHCGGLRSLSNVELPKSAEDVAFDEAASYVATLDPQLQAVHKHVAGMVKKERGACNCTAWVLLRSHSLFGGYGCAAAELATTYQDFGLALSRLGQAEEGTYGAALVHVGSTADRAAQLTAEQVRPDRLPRPPLS